MMSKLQGKLKYTSTASLQLGQKRQVKALEPNQFEATVPDLLDCIKKCLHLSMRMYLNKTTYILMLLKVLH